jgi:hypothetical protein
VVNVSVFIRAIVKAKQSVTPISEELDKPVTFQGLEVNGLWFLVGHQLPWPLAEAFLEKPVQ